MCLLLWLLRLDLGDPSFAEHYIINAREQGWFRLPLRAAAHERALGAAVLSPLQPTGGEGPVLHSHGAAEGVASAAKRNQEEHGATGKSVLRRARRPTEPLDRACWATASSPPAHAEIRTALHSARSRAGAAGDLAVIAEVSVRPRYASFLVKERLAAAPRARRKGAVRERRVPCFRTAPTTCRLARSCRSREGLQTGSPRPR